MALSPKPGPHSLQGYIRVPLPRCVFASLVGSGAHVDPVPCLGPQVELSDGTAHTITDAYAGKEYIIQVAAKDNEIGTWSDWSVAAHATPWTEEPRHLTTEAQAPGEPACPQPRPAPLRPAPPRSTPPHSARPRPALCFMPSSSSWEQSLCHTPSLAVTDIPIYPMPVFLVLFSTCPW